eukprot:4622575-Amphidinium_carterae.1
MHGQVACIGVIPKREGVFDRIPQCALREQGDTEIGWKPLDPNGTQVSWAYCEESNQATVHRVCIDLLSMLK